MPLLALQKTAPYRKIIAQIISTSLRGELMAAFAYANDMGKFLHLFLKTNNDVLSNDSLQMMREKQNDSDGLDGDTRFGLSFSLSPRGEEPFVMEHGGDLHPYHASLRILPKDSLGIVIMTNSNRGASWVYYMTTQILDVAYSATSTHKPESRRKAEHARKIRLTEEQARDYAGLYYAQLGSMTIHILKFSSPRSMGENSYG